MEALNILYQKVELPTHFFLLFIKNIITTHKDIQEPKDKKKFFRYFCVFLTNIIEFEHIKIDEIKDDFIRNFIHENSSDKDATNLCSKLFNEKKNN
jgi:hypothetical protein